MRRWMRVARMRVRSLVLLRRVDEELNEELQFHFEKKVQEFAAQGMTPEAARCAAMRAMDGMERRKEECRDMRGVKWIQDLVQDASYGVRMPRRSPGFMIIAVLTLALGIGANTAMFSAVNAILLRPLPYAHSERLVDIEATPMMNCPVPDFLQIQAKSRTLGPMALVGDARGQMTGAGAPVSFHFTDVSADFFPMLGVRPLYGRWFLPSEMQAGNEHEVILSYKLWRESFGSDPGAVGRKVMLDGASYEVVGVMPPDFSLPARTPLWRPLVLTADEMAHRYGFSSALADIRPGRSTEEVQAELNVIAAQLNTSNPNLYRGVRYQTAPIKEGVVAGARLPLLILLGAAGFVLLIACANLASLSLARGWARRPELAVRATLGATRGRLVRLLLTESVVLAIAGGIAGILLAFWGAAVLRQLLPAGTPRLNELRVDQWTLWFALGISVLAGLMFGTAPALIASRENPHEVVKEGGARSSGALASRRGNWLRRVLVVAEIALAFVLAAGTGLALRSLSRLLNVDFGFRIDHLLTMVLPTPASERRDPNFDARPYSRAILEKFGALPGVKSVGGVVGGIGGLRPMHLDGMLDPNIASRPAIMLDTATPKYFGTLETPSIAGRDFAPSDGQNATLVAIVNKRFAQAYFGGANPVGKRMTLPAWLQTKPEQVEIVGEVGDMREPRAPAYRAWATVYLDYFQYREGGAVSPVVRSIGEPMALAGTVRAVVASVWKDEPVEGLTTMEQQLSAGTATPRSRAMLLGTFGALGLVLAMVGIYGLMSYSVTQRTHEIGLRMALGAEPGDVMRMVVGQGARLAAAGIAVGLGGAWALTRYMRSFLFGLNSNDPLTFAGVAILLATVALAASYAPARRAMRVDPMAALRHE
ncbi:MAG TPA: ABC transporter permease [Candidatus Acidoferrales bacterium]|nr:ABC transporter permease [Candidatus Acidoferrales bacterium]